VVFTVARYHSLVVLERSRIATRLSVSCGASDSHSLVMLILLHARRGIVVVVCLHARRGIVVVVFLPALHHLRYARQTSLMRGGLPSCPVRPSVYAVVFRSARHGMAAVFRSARRGVTNLAQQAPWRRRRCHSHPCRPVARPRFRCHSRGHPPRLGASTDLCHIAPVAISPTAGRSRPLSFVSVMLLARPSFVIVMYVVSC